ncbi:MAG: hypothetical protein NC084_13615 [Bacteroides sp.]|nr:hypothetical protein [Eubacterium sp.]MCM1463734.1 hypothetical protein [Bacteroides sp.]
MSKIVIENLLKLNIGRQELLKIGLPTQKYDDVSRGKSNYKIDELILISKSFGISSDYLLGITSKDKEDELSSHDLTFEGSVFSEEEKKLISAYRSFNSEGKARLLDTVTDMELLDHYKKRSSASEEVS